MAVTDPILAHTPWSRNRGGAEGKRDKLGNWPAHQPMEEVSHLHLGQARHPHLWGLVSLG